MPLAAFTDGLTPRRSLAASGKTSLRQGAEVMMGKVPGLSIVCPAYEEEVALPAFHEQLLRALQPLEDAFDIEVLYVDDGSHDGTLSLLRQWAWSDYRVRYLSLSRNFGHQAALTAGLEHARGDVVVTLDSDLQHPPQLIPEMVQRWKQGYDIVLTIRQDDPMLGRVKRLTSQWFYTLMRWCAETETRPAAADFRLMSRRAVDSLLRLGETHRFLRGMVGWLGFPTTDLVYRPARRVAGRSKYNLRRMVSFAGDALFSFSRVPLRLSLVLGLVLLPAGSVLALLVIVRFLSGCTTAADGTLLILSGLGLVGAAILGSLGVIGEYIARIYEQVKGRPIYLLKETEQGLANSETGRQGDRETRRQKEGSPVSLSPCLPVSLSPK